MNFRIEKTATNITKYMYANINSDEHKGMKHAVSRLLEILILNVGLIISLYFISASLSILSLFITGISSCVIYSIIKKLYRDLRVEGTYSTTSNRADIEFNSIISLITSSSWQYVIMGIAHIQEILKR